jgi:starch synthase (maltosyl-transferring)
MRDAAQRSDGAIAPRPTPGRGAPERIVIEGVSPEVDGGRFPAKRSVGETVTVAADVFAEGHDRLTAVLRHRHVDDDAWRETPMTALANDRWEAMFHVTRLGLYEYVVHAWVDAFASWRAALAKKHDAGSSRARRSSPARRRGRAGGSATGSRRRQS